MVDAAWTLVWVSRELQALLGSDDPEELGVGRHLVEAQLRPPWRSAISDDTELAQFQRQLPMMIGGTPGGRAALKRLLPEAAHGWLDEVEPVPVPPAWTSVIEFIQDDLPPARVRVLDVRLGSEREPLGALRLYGSDLPARVLALVGRGDEGMFERMARIFRPHQRGAAILFADLEASGELARRLPSEAYFGLIRELTTRVDELVISRAGIVGKHVGDGVTAFFVTDDFPSHSAAARTAIETGRSIGTVTEEIGAGMEFLSPDDLRLNLGLHWGDRLFMGQVVTGGRIEVTALGDEVNECARLEQAAQKGQILASKNLIERLDLEDAAGLDLVPNQLSYRPLASLPGVPQKAIRDAGAIAVADIRRPPSEA